MSFCFLFDPIITNIENKASGGYNESKRDLERAGQGFILKKINR